MQILPNSELEIMMIVWESNKPITRMEIEKKLQERGRILNKTSILTFLSRLQSRGFVDIVKESKNNLYSAKISENEYMQYESKRILKSMYHNSLKKFVCSLYDGESISQEDLLELKKYIDEKI